jgi:3-hydroxyisobutyrate dehydrogenase
MKVGLVGLGRMGAAIGQRLNERGCDVVAWDRNPKAREVQGKRGLRLVNGPRAVADEAEVVLSIITEDKGVRQIFTAPDGFLSGEVKGKLFVEMSTLQPMTHRELAPIVKAKGASLVDSPVMGSIPTVREASCSRCSAGRPPTSSVPAPCSTISRAASCISAPTAPAAP